MLDACFSEAIKLNKLFLQLNVLKDSWLVGWYERKGFNIIYVDDNEYTMWKQLDFKPQIWKTSEEQIVALRWVLNNVPYNKHKEEISGLLDQIKDL